MLSDVAVGSQIAKQLAVGIVDGNIASQRACPNAVLVVEHDAAHFLQLRDMGDAAPAETDHCQIVFTRIPKVALSIEEPPLDDGLSKVGAQLAAHQLVMLLIIVAKESLVGGSPQRVVAVFMEKRMRTLFQR